MSEEFVAELTDEHFDLFKSTAIYYIDFFGLCGWNINFLHVKINALAECRTHLQSKLCNLVLTTQYTFYDENPDDQRLKSAVTRAAFHEVWELILTEFSTVSFDADLSRAAREEWIERITHDVIRRLENKVLPLTENARLNLG